MEKIYDVTVIGGGPAGYTSALYTSRAGFETLLIEKFSAGGQMTQTQQIDNYPGFEEGIDGFTLGFKMQQGAERFGTVTLQTEVLSVELGGDVKKIVTADGEFFARCVIIATGAEHKHLGLAEEESLIGRGVGYCAACDGNFYKGKRVAVIGGGNSAAADALLLSKICESVTVVHRRDSLRAERVYHKPLMSTENVTFEWNSEVTDILADTRVNGIRIRNVKDGSEKEIELDGVFISIGRAPATEIFAGQIELDPSGYVVADESTKTSALGVFAVGDVRTKHVRQIVTAVADGATASHFAEEYLANEHV